MAAKHLQQLQQVLENLDTDAQRQALDAVTRQVRHKRKNEVKARYARRKYHEDPLYKQKVIERSNQRTAVKYATDADWRVKVREQQSQYYHAKHHRPHSASTGNCRLHTPAAHATPAPLIGM